MGYGIPVILHTDHCQRSWLPWFDGLMDANKKYYKKNGEPLFSSHMLDLSEEPLEENVGTCVEYLTRMAKSDIPVILHTDHCQRSWLPWFDGLMDANEEFMAKRLVEAAEDLNCINVI